MTGWRRRARSGLKRRRSQGHPAPGDSAPGDSAPGYGAQRHRAPRHRAPRHRASRHDVPRHDVPRHAVAGHRSLVALLTGALALIALLIFMANEATGPGLTPQQRAARPPVHRQTPNRLYGAALAPASQRINPPRLKLDLRSGLLFDVRTGRVLWARDPTAVVPIASLTKMMTALVVVAHTKPGDGVPVTPAAVHFTGSGVGLLPLGRWVPVLPLLYGLLLPSGNDAAIALAQHVAGSEPRFIEMMNERAQAMGLTCTHFSTVSGIVDQGNYSCAKDVAVLAHAVLAQPLLSQIVASRSAVLPFPIKGGKLFLYNNNPLLLLRYPGTDGVKTGYTQAAGQCLVAAARRGGAWLGVVLLHSGDTSDQAQQLLNAGFAPRNAR